MKLKSKILSIAAAAVMLAASVSALTACAHTHKLDKFDAKEATCTADGNTVYYHCEGCDKYFEDENAEKEITDLTQVTVRASHDWNTTWEHSDTEHWHTCKNCGEKGSKSSHREAEIEAVAADCQNTGLTAGKKCSVCETILVAQEETPFADHDYAKKWKSDKTKHWHECKVCGDKNAEAEHSFTLETVNEKYYKESGDCFHATYYKSCECGVAGEETFTVEESRHSWGEFEEKDGALTRECAVCGKVHLKSKIEAEDAILGGTGGSVVKNQYISFGNAASEVIITYNIYATADTEAELVCALGKAGNTMNMKQLFHIYLNDEEYTEYKDFEVLSQDWEVFKEFTVGTISLNKGVNTLVFKSIPNSIGVAYNFDCIYLLAEEPLVLHDPNAKPDECKHNWSEFEEKDGLLTRECAICGKVQIKNRLEAEDAVLGGTGGSVVKDSYISFGNAASEVIITYNISATAATDAELVLLLGKAGTAMNMKQLFHIYLNDEEITDYKDFQVTAQGWETFNEFSVGTVSLNEGANTLVIKSIPNTIMVAYNFDCIYLLGEEVVTFASDVKPELKSYKFEAENAALTAGANKTDKTDDKISGTGYVGFSFTGESKTLTFTVNSDKETDAELSFAIIEPSSQLWNYYIFNSVNVNGTDLFTSSTGDGFIINSAAAFAWENFKEMKWGTIHLKEGVNTIIVTVDTYCGQNWSINFDYMLLSTEDAVLSTGTGAAQKTSYKFEAENAVLTDGANKTDKAGDHISGTGYVGFSFTGETKTLTFTINSDKETDAELSFAIIEPVSDLWNYYIFNSVNVNGKDLFTDKTGDGFVIKSAASFGWENFKEMKWGTIHLNEGVNAIVITVDTYCGQNWSINFDYMLLVTQDAVLS